MLILWIVRGKLFTNLETGGRIFVVCSLISLIIFIQTIGRILSPDEIQTEYIPHLTIELIGLSVAVLLIDRVNNFISRKHEELYRRLSLITCKMPIFTYCYNWLLIFDANPDKRKQKLEKYDNLGAFFSSDEFYTGIVSFDFNNRISGNKTYAEYYSDGMKKVQDRFQAILSKYASKLSLKDIQLLEHFGGNSFMFTVFEIINSLSQVIVTTTVDNLTQTVTHPFNNSFRDITKENFQKHFIKLVELIDQYNSAVDDEYEKWTISSFTELNTVAKANNNSATKW
jgi:hypothetical protein